MLSTVIITLMIAGIAIGPSDQYPLGREVLVETAPRTEEWSIYSNLLWLDDVMEYDGVNNVVNVSANDWPEWLACFRHRHFALRI